MFHPTRSTSRALIAIPLGCLLAAALLTGQASPAGASTAVKPIIHGLIDRQGPPPVSMQSVVQAFVVKVNWADLQPTAFGPIASNNAIDQAIALVSQPPYSTLGYTLKLRVFAGVDAPDWAKNIDGPPIPYVNNQPGASVAGGTIGRFWTADFGKAYADLMTKLAAKYDKVPVIREVTDSRCSTIYDEPFVRQWGDADNVTAMQAAGYTVAADEQCIADSITEHKVWKRTTTDIDFSPFPLITNPNGGRDLAFTESMMTTCRQVLGDRCGLENNGLTSSNLASKPFQQMYANMTLLGPSIVMQTGSTTQIGDPQQVLNAAISIGSTSVELPQGYASWSMSMLQAADQALLANTSSG